MVDQNQAYFAQYTGIKGWGNILKPFFSNVHESRIRINYTYYNNSSLMMRIFDWYNKIDPDGDHFDYTVIDDGSQKVPINTLDYPKHWSVLRIEEDMGWNNEGARNCLMRYTKNRWNLVLDSDWVVTRKNLVRLKRAVSNKMLERDVVYMPGNFGYNTMRNSYFISRDYFWDIGGYDQAFIGYHGNDYSFLKMSNTYDFSDFFRLSRIVLDVIDPNEKNRMDRVKEFHKLLEQLESKGFGFRDKADKQDFTWTNKEEHKKMWKDIKFTVVNQ